MASSFRAVTDTVVYLDNFQNVDLFFQGYYYFRTRLFYEDEAANMRVYATPLCQYLTSEVELRAQNTDQRSFKNNNQQVMSRPTHSARPPSSLEGMHSPSQMTQDNSSYGASNFTKPRNSPNRIFKNNLSHYNENASQIYQSVHGSGPVKLKKKVSNGSTDTSQQRLFGQQSQDLNNKNASKLDQSQITSQAQQSSQAEVPVLRPQHDIRRAEQYQKELSFHSRIFYIRQSDERVNLGEILNFKSEFEANLDIDALSNASKTAKCQENIFGSKKFYLEVSMCFKEATSTEIENNEMVQLHMSAEEAKADFKVVSTCKLLLRNSSRSGLFHFYPVSFDTGYFSCLSLCVNSIVKEFKFKPTSLYQELNAQQTAAFKQPTQKVIEPIDSSKPISAYNDCVADSGKSFAAKVADGKHEKLSRTQIEGLQSIYLETLAQIYKQARQLYTKLLRQIKPSAFMEVQGMQSQYNSQRGVSIRKELDQLPPAIRVDNLYAMLLLQESLAKKGMSHISNRSTNLVTMPHHQSQNSLAMSNNAPHLTFGMSNKMSSIRPSMAFNANKASVIAQPEPVNPSYISKPVRTDQSSIEDGFGSIEAGDSPRSLSGQDLQLQVLQACKSDDDDVGDVSSRSCSVSHLYLDTDYHHIPDAASLQRSKKKKSSLNQTVDNRTKRGELTIDSMVMHPGHRKQLTKQTTMHVKSEAQEDGLQNTISQQESPRTNNMFPQKQPKFIMNVNKLTTIQMLSKKQYEDQIIDQQSNRFTSPFSTSKKTLKNSYREGAQTISKTKKKHSNAKYRSTQKEYLQQSHGDSRKQSCLQLSDFLCINPKKRQPDAKKPQIASTSGISLKADDNIYDFLSSDNDGYIAQKVQRSSEQDMHSSQMSDASDNLINENSYYKRSTQLQTKQKPVTDSHYYRGMNAGAASRKPYAYNTNQAVPLANSCSANDLAIMRNCSPTDGVLITENDTSERIHKILSHSKSDNGLSIASPVNSDRKQTKYNMVSDKQIQATKMLMHKSMKGPKPYKVNTQRDRVDNKLLMHNASVTQNVQKLVTGRTTAKYTASAKSPTLKSAKGERRHRNTCKNQGTVTLTKQAKPIAGKKKQIARSPTTKQLPQSMISSKTTKFTSPRQQQPVSARKNTQALTQYSSKRSSTFLQLNQMLQSQPLDNQQPRKSGPTMRAAVPSFSGATKELDMAIEKAEKHEQVIISKRLNVPQQMLNRMSQPIQSPSPYLDDSDTNQKGSTTQREMMQGSKTSNHKHQHSQHMQINSLLSTKNDSNYMRKKQLSDLLESVPTGTLNSSSMINQERSAGVPKVSSDQQGKYGKKLQPRTSLMQLKDQIRQKSSLDQDCTDKVGMKRNTNTKTLKHHPSISMGGNMQTHQQYDEQSALIMPTKTRDTRRAQLARAFTEAEDENIEEEVNDTSVLTLDFMTRQIQHNLNHLGSNNPFSHHKVTKPGTRENNNKGAVSHRNSTQKFNLKNGSEQKSIFTGQRPKDYFSTMNQPIKTSQQQLMAQTTRHVKQKEVSQQSQSRLLHRSPSDQRRQVPAIFTKNSVLETRGTELIKLHDSPTMASVMEMHKRQLNVSNMGNNLTCKNTRMLNLENVPMTAQTSSVKNTNTLSKQKTIEGIFISGVAKKSQRTVKQIVNDSFRGSTINGHNQQQLSAATKVINSLQQKTGDQLFDIRQVHGVMDKQMRQLTNELFKIWYKIGRIIYLDPQCLEKVLRLRYEKIVNKYYSQMVVEYRNDEESKHPEEQQHQSSSMLQANSMLEPWRAEQLGVKENSFTRHQNKPFLIGSTLFQNIPAEEGVLNKGKKAVGLKYQSDKPTPVQNRRKVYSIYEQSHNMSHIGSYTNTDEKTDQDKRKKEAQAICEEDFVYTPNSRKVNSNSVYRTQKDSQSMRSHQNKIDSGRGRLQQRGRDNSANTLGGKPISPRQIERSLVMARDRRQECSQVRQSLPFNQAVKEAIDDQKYTKQLQPYGFMTSQSSSDDSDQGPTEQKKMKAKNMKVSIKHRTQLKFKLPIQQIRTVKTANGHQHVTAQDFEPIIIEEVFYNGRFVVENESKQRKLTAMTPQLIFDQIRQLQESSLTSSFMSNTNEQGPTQIANHPNLTMHNRRIMKHNRMEQSSMSVLLSRKPLKNKSVSAGRVDTDESCDFFSDNLSETAAGQLPESQTHDPKSTPAKKGYHLFVFVHGFQASSQDMRSFRNHLQILLPNAMFLVSQANEKDTDSRIEDLGFNLAQEVKEFIISYLSGFHSINNERVQVVLSKLTFVGHSLGGIIVRESLKHLQNYKKYLHGYVSLGSAHLGYMYNSTSIVDAGIWLIKKFKQSESLKQLSMSDHEEKRQTYLYKLSQSQSLDDFKYVILVSSYQDSYAPHDSARIQMTSQAAGSKDNTKSRIYLDMVENILGQMQCEKLFRLDVNFKIQDTSLASLIGRTAHILMIECKPFYLNLIYRYRQVFCE